MTAAPCPDTAADPVRVIRGLCRELAAARLRYANLLAAARATVSAARDGDPDALEFLVDELAAQHGQHDLDPRLHWVDEVGWTDEVGRSDEVGRPDGRSDEVGW
jgi:hypothetical protein